MMAAFLAALHSGSGTQRRVHVWVQSMLGHAYLGLIIVVFVVFASTLGWVTWHNP